MKNEWMNSGSEKRTPFTLVFHSFRVSFPSVKWRNGIEFNTPFGHSARNQSIFPSFHWRNWIDLIAVASFPAPCFLNRRLIHAALPFLLAQLKERTEMGCASVSSGTSLPSFMLHFGSSCLLHSVSPVPSSTHYIPSFRLPPFLCLVPLHSPSVHSVNSLTLCSFGNFRLLRALFS